MRIFKPTLIVLWLLSAAMGAATGCDSVTQCGNRHTNQSGECGGGDLSSCEYDACELRFRECDDGVERGYECSGDTCTCFGGSTATCAFTPDHCRDLVEIGFSGDSTPSMQKYEECCGEYIEPG